MGALHLWDLFQFLFLFGLVVALAYYTSRFLGARLGWQGMAGRLLRVIEAVPAGRDRTLLLVEAAGRYYLVGAAPGQVSLVAELDDPEAVARIRAAAAPVPAGPAAPAVPGREPFRAVLARALRRSGALVGRRADPAAGGAEEREPAATRKLAERLERLRALGRGPRP